MLKNRNGLIWFYEVFCWVEIFGIPKMKGWLAWIRVYAVFCAELKKNL